MTTHADDDNRIVLQPMSGQEDCQSDYINACYVDVSVWVCVVCAVSSVAVYTRAPGMIVQLLYSSQRVRVVLAVQHGDMTLWDMTL